MGTNDSIRDERDQKQNMIHAENLASSRTRDLEIEKQWLRRARIDLGNFTFFYDKYYSAIFKFTYLRTGDKDRADDVTNETFSRALTGLGKFKWQGYALGAWLFQIARNILRREHRDRKKRSEIPFEAGRHSQVERWTPEKEYERLEDEQILRLSIAELDPLRQDVFVLHYWMEMSTREVAAAMELPEGTVKSHLQRGRKELLISLSENGLRYGISEKALNVVRGALARDDGWKLMSGIEGGSSNDKRDPHQDGELDE